MNFETSIYILHLVAREMDFQFDVLRITPRRDECIKSQRENMLKESTPANFSGEWVLGQVSLFDGQIPSHL